ncbi:MAG: hypothetical protein J5586_04655 [Clostridia bacterium]|nr:hypothetical protein [Clostridia bacterium]
MKELFGADITTLRKNDEFDCVGYETKKISDELNGSIEALSDSAEKLDEETSLPKALRILQWAAGIGVLLIASGIIRNIGDLPFSQMFANAPWLFVVAGILAVVWAALFIASIMKKKSVAETGVIDDFKQVVDETLEKAMAELNVPDNAEKIDALLYRYKTKNGENKIFDYSLIGHFTNSTAYVFGQNGCFCIFDGGSRFDIPMKDLKRIEIVRKKMSLMGWNKDVDFNKEPYREYTMPNEDGYGRIWLRSHCRLIFDLQGEEFCFRFPEYDLGAVEAITGLRAEE